MLKKTSLIFPLAKKLRLIKDCLIDDNYNFTKSFIADLEQLPLKRKRPSLQNLWRSYQDFLEEYGTHVITSIWRS